jgi:hypothetical protein
MESTKPIKIGQLGNISLQQMAERNATTIFTDEIDLQFDVSFSNTFDNRRASLNALATGAGMSSRSDSFKISEVFTIDGELEIVKRLVGSENTKITIDDPSTNTVWKVPAKESAGNYIFAAMDDVQKANQQSIINALIFG